MLNLCCAVDNLFVHSHCCNYEVTKMIHHQHKCLLFQELFLHFTFQINSFSLNSFWCTIILTFLAHSQWFEMKRWWRCVIAYMHQYEMVNFWRNATFLKENNCLARLFPLRHIQNPLCVILALPWNQIPLVCAGWVVCVCRGLCVFVRGCMRPYSCPFARCITSCVSLTGPVTRRPPRHATLFPLRPTGSDICEMLTWWVAVLLQGLRMLLI